ncbi:hypothetical protein [Microcoleus sp. herbarium14]|uniref:hypothetical protein n=1 Tax=Microcoleus sp. herbarium14 TaxID=3055439 RepID=UPI002FCF5F68
MNQKILDLIVGTLAVISAVSSFTFWIASRQIKDELFHRIDKISDNLRSKLETDFIRNTNRLLRWQDKNQIKNATLEARLTRIEKILLIENDPMLQKINDSLSSEITDIP